MHIPDGFLDLKTAATAGALAVAGVAVAIRQAGRALPRRQVPLLGVAAAFIFAAQMLNFPVLGGTSGHLVGATLAVILLGPHAAVLVMTTVLLVQCFLFNDGGVSALGANIFNMALLGTGTAWLLYRGVRVAVAGPRGRVFAAVLAGWCSTVVAAVSCVAQLSWSGTTAWSTALPAMFHVHLLIGLVEGVITALVVAAVAHARPELLEPAGPHADRALGPTVGIALLVSFGLVLFVAPLACPWPDGLEHVAEQLGFAEYATEPLTGAPLPDYALPGWPGWSTAVGGMVGTVVTLVVAWLLARTLVRDPTAERS